MRIGVLTTSYPRSDDDPAGHFVAGFARWLARHVGSVEVLCAHPARTLFYRGGAPGALAVGRGWPEAARFSMALLSGAARRVARWDAIVSHWLVPSGAVGLAVAGARPHLAIAHGSDVALLERLPGGGALAGALARSADLVYAARALIGHGALGRVVPMGIDVEAVVGGDREAARAALGVAVDEKVALFLGRLVREKGADLAIAALPDGATLLIAGDGPERAALARQARGRRVRLLGEVRGAAKRALLAAADVLVLPSRSDGAPTVIREAHAAGLPVVATRVGGIPELIRDGHDGLLCDPTVPSLRNGLVRVAGDRAWARALGEAARAAAAATDWSRVGPLLAGALVDGRGRGAGELVVCPL
jgi:glycosyltransferase involved in cell wall biosynthesis